MDRLKQRFTTLCVPLLFVAPLGSAIADDTVNVSVSSAGVTWQAVDGYADAQLRVGGNGMDIEQAYEAGNSLRFDAYGLADGTYHYQLTLMPSGVNEAREAMLAARDAGEEDTYNRLADELQFDYEPRTVTGKFRVQNAVAETFDEEAIAAEEQAEADALAAEEAAASFEMED